jgi:hypothetical protein
MGFYMNAARATALPTFMQRDVGKPLIPHGLTALPCKIRGFRVNSATFTETFADSKGLNGFVLQNEGCFNFVGNICI